MDDVDLVAADDLDQRRRVAADDQRVFRRQRQADMRRAGARQLALHRPALGRDIGGPACGGQRGGDLDGAALHTTRDKARDHLQHGGRAGFLRSLVDGILACHFVAVTASSHANTRYSAGIR